VNKGDLVNEVAKFVAGKGLKDAVSKSVFRGIVVIRKGS